MTDQPPKRPLRSSRPWWSVSIRRLGKLALGFYVLILGLLVVFQGKLIFPAPTDFEQDTPASQGLAFEDLSIPVDAKTHIHGWWIPAADPEARVILYFHGNAEVLEQEADLEVLRFHGTGSSLLSVDYRGYGTSSPLRPTGNTTAEDARAALRYLEQVRHIPASHVVIAGWSVGTGVAAQLALEAPDAAGLILVSPITSVYDTANQNWVFRYVLRPAEWLRHDSEFRTKAKIGSIHIPVLLVTGTRDPIAPPWMAEELYQRAHEPKRMRLLEGASHNDIMDPKNMTFLPEVEAFLDALPKLHPRSTVEKTPAK